MAIKPFSTRVSELERINMTEKLVEVEALTEALQNAANKSRDERKGINDVWININHPLMSAYKIRSFPAVGSYYGTFPSRYIEIVNIKTGERFYQTGFWALPSIAQAIIEKELIP